MISTSTSLRPRPSVYRVLTLLNFLAETEDQHRHLLPPVFAWFIQNYQTLPLIELWSSSVELTTNEAGTVSFEWRITRGVTTQARDLRPTLMKRALVAARLPIPVPARPGPQPLRTRRAQTAGISARTNHDILLPGSFSNTTLTTSTRDTEGSNITTSTRDTEGSNMISNMTARQFPRAPMITPEDSRTMHVPIDVDCSLWSVAKTNAHVLRNQKNCRICIPPFLQKQGDLVEKIKESIDGRNHMLVESLNAVNQELIYVFLSHREGLRDHSEQLGRTVTAKLVKFVEVETFLLIQSQSQSQTTSNK